MKSKTIKLCLQDYIFRSYHFLVEVTVAVSAINANENEYSQDNIAKKHRISQSQISRWIEKKDNIMKMMILHIVSYFGKDLEQPNIITLLKCSL